MMNVIVFRPANTDQSVSLSQLIELWSHPARVLACATVAELLNVLDAQEAGRHESLLVLLIENRGQLEAICGASDQLAERHCVLVVPDFAEETLALGHRLYPRFVTSFDAPAERLGSVLMKMMHNARTEVPQRTKAPRASKCLASGRATMESKTAGVPGD